VTNFEAKYEDNLMSEYSDRLHSQMAAPRASRPTFPPSRHRTPRNLKGKRITNRAQTKVAFRLPRKHDTSNP
jgi:hypothetical protein